MTRSEDEKPKQDAPTETNSEAGQVAGEGNGGAEGRGAELTQPARQALRWYYDRQSLNEADRKSLWEERGLNDATVELLGFRSNPDTNKGLLLEMGKHFPLAVLVESGLWKEDVTKVGELAKPNPQFHGMSILERRDAAGKKIRNANGEVLRECVWNHPILIPYFNEAGELFHLRPHKGMMAGKSSRLYVVRPRGQASRTTRQGVGGEIGLVAEGEFKAAAVWQALGDEVEVASLPGITMAKPLIGEVEDWLESRGIRQVVVVYDNEDKADERLPGYQPEKHRRFDAPIWARYLARQLSRQGYDGKAGRLPDEWRDDQGKADWDGYLAVLVRRLGCIDGSPAEWEKVRNQVRSTFLAVIQSAVPIGESWSPSVFDPETEKIIRSAVDRISYEPCLPVGGDEEQGLARRFHLLATRLKQKDWVPLRAAAYLRVLAKAYQATAGRYYVMIALTEKLLEFWRDLKTQAQARGDDDAKRACDLVLRGRKSLKATRRGHMPEPVSDFYLIPHYVLHRANGTRTRMVTIRSIHGVNTTKVELAGEALGSPVKLRQWLHENSTGAAFFPGQSELTAIHEDLAHALAFLDITEVPVRGYHAESKTWFFEDVAFSDGGEFTPDPKTGIFWIKGGAGVRGYTFARDSAGCPRDREGEVFRQGTPCMHPDRVSLVEEDRAFFSEMVGKLREALGGMEAFLALGMVLAVAAGPEIFQEWSCFPGLWVHGPPGEGKSSLVRWLIRLWGFMKVKGLPLPADDQRSTVTLPALSGALGQLGELPFWLDEMQSTTPPWVRSILKNSYDRAEGAKKDFGDSPREYLASIIVSGVATSTDPQTRSRFAHIQVSARARQGNDYDWFQAHSHDFYRLGRFVMRHRQRFVASVLEALRTWVESTAMQGVDDRARMVYGVGYAGFRAACELFDMPVELQAYWRWLADYCRRKAAEVQESVSVDLFWHEVLTGLDAGAFGPSVADWRKYFHVVEDKAAKSPVSEQQARLGAEQSFKAWKSYVLYFRSGPVIDLLRTFKRRSGGDFPTSPTDLLNQMRMQPYWHPAKHALGHRQKFGGAATQTCWGIRVDLHPSGLIQVTDEEFNESAARGVDPETFGSTHPWGDDPRKGDLFALINPLLEKRHADQD